MKGISAVIAVILMLLITVGLAGMAWVWFGTVFGGLTSPIANETTRIGKELGTKFTINTARYVSQYGNITITITNTGSQDIDTSKMVAVINSTSASFSPVAILPAGYPFDFYIINTPIMGNVCNQALELSIGTFSQTKTIAC